MSEPNQRAEPAAPPAASATAELQRRNEAPRAVVPAAHTAAQAIAPEMRWLAGTVIAALVIAALYYGRQLLIPLALAILLGFLLDPAVSRLKRWGVPRMAAAVLMVALILATLGGLGFYLGKQVQQLSNDLPRYQNTIKQKLRNLRNLASGPSAWDGARATYNTVESELEKTARVLGAASNVQKVEVVAGPVRPMDIALAWLAKVAEPIALVGIVLLFAILILLDRDDLRDRLLRLMGGNLHVATDALDEASDRIGNYLRMQFTVNVTYGVPMALGLWFIGVPGAVLWGVLATIMRFVPYVGPMISAVFPLVVAFAVDPGWDVFLMTLGLIVVLELISNNVVEPWLYGSSTGLSTLAILLAATFWTALWGPIGLILSTPLTVCLLVLGRYLPGLQFLEVLLGSAPVLDAPQRLYQRLLADDVSEATELARGEIATRQRHAAAGNDGADAVIGFYDEVLIPMLKLASRHHSESATVEHRVRLSNGLEVLLEELQDAHPARPREELDRHARVLCVGARWEVDALAADIAAHALRLAGHPATSAGQAAVAADLVADIEEDVQWLVLSSFHAQPQALSRSIARRVRRRLPHVRVLLAAWNVPQRANALAQSDFPTAWGVERVVRGMQELVQRLAQLQTPGRSVQGHMPAARRDDDPQRVAHLRETGFLNEAHLPLFRAAVLKAANAFNTKYAQVSLVDTDWVHAPGSLLVPADRGDAVQGLPRDLSICSYVVRDGVPLVVQDTERDPRFSDSAPLKQAHVRFYAGVPLTDIQGDILGTLCVLDQVPRDMGEDELGILREMARDLVEQLHEHRPPP